MHRSFICVGALALVTMACAKKDTSTSDTTVSPAPAGAARAATDPTATKLGETTDLKTPESVRYDPELDLFYISNINGNPSQHDGNGFIAVIRGDSTGSKVK